MLSLGITELLIARSCQLILLLCEQPGGVRRTDYRCRDAQKQGVRVFGAFVHQRRICLNHSRKVVLV